jgi:hypothetical protein
VFAVVIRIVPLLLTLAAARAEAQVGLQLEAGLDGKIRTGRWAPFQVTATNRGEPVIGRIELSLSDSRTAVPIELPTASNKRVETTLLPQVPSGYYRIAPDTAVAILRVDRQEAASTRVRVQVVSDSARLLVVCGDASSGLRFLNGVSLSDAGWSLPPQAQGRAQMDTTVTAHPLPSAMPSDWTGLDAADLLVMRDVAWGQLEPAQRRAVRRWVEMGGRVLLCGEDPAGFSDAEGRRLLPVRFLGPRPRDSLTAFPLPDREPIRPPAGRVMTVGARPLPDAIVGLREGEQPILVTRFNGFGAVLWLGFDPFRVAPERDSGRRALWAFLIGRGSGALVRDPAFPDLADVVAAYGPVKTLPHFPTPSRWTLGSFGLVYVAVFGPLNIWLLRRLRRTVRAWLLMPVLSLGITGGVLAVGTSWGRARVVFHTVSVLEAMSGSGTARELSYGALFSPASRAFGLEIDDPSPVVRLLGEGGDGQQAAGSAPGYRPPRVAALPPLREGDLSRWEQFSMALWTIQPFQVEQAADLGGGVRMSIDDHLSGSIVNGTDRRLRDVYLQYHGWRCAVGELPPGAARKIASTGWRRRRLLDERASQGSISAYHPATQAAASEGDDLFTTVGSLLQGSLERSEVLLVARAPDLSPPLRVPGVPRSPAPGLKEGAILVVRQPVGEPVGFGPGEPPAVRGGR